MIKYLNNKLILLEESITKKELLEKMVDLAAKESKYALDREVFLEKVLEREKAGTTSIGRGIAIPHARCETLKNIVLVVAIIKDGVDFNNIDSELTRMVLLLGAPKDKNTEYLYLLSKISKSFRNNKLRKEIFEVEDKEDVLELLAGYFED